MIQNNNFRYPSAIRVWRVSAIKKEQLQQKQQCYVGWIGLTTRNGNTFSHWLGCPPLIIYDIFVETCSLHVFVWFYLDFTTGICLRYTTNRSYEILFLNWPITYANKVDSKFKFTLYVCEVSVHLEENSWGRCGRCGWGTTSWNQGPLSQTDWLNQHRDYDMDHIHVKQCGPITHSYLSFSGCFVKCRWGSGMDEQLHKIMLQDIFTHPFNNLK